MRAGLARHSTRSGSPAARTAAVLALGGAAVVLAACSAAGSAAGGSAAGTGRSQGAVPRAGQLASGSGGAVGAPQGTTLSASAPATRAQQPVDLLLGRSVIRTAALTVRVRDVLSAAARAGSLAAGLGGFVAGEQTQASPDQPSHAVAVLTLRVPASALPALVGQLAGLGTLVTETQNAQDVTGQVIDVQARIAAQRASVARVSALMAKATTLGQVVEIEGELTRRQADLESLEGQAAALTDQTALGTVTTTIVGRSAVVVAKPKPAPPTGFGAGLARGWHGFADAATWLATGLGTALPFGIVAVPLVLVAVLVRRRLVEVEPVQTAPPVPPAAAA